MSVDWNKPLELKNNDNDVRTNCHYVGLDPNRPYRPRVISYLREGVAFTTHATESGEHSSFRVINVPEPPAWMVKAAEELVQYYDPRILMILTKQKAIEILMKHAKEAV